MQKIYISFLILALAGCSGRSRQTFTTQPRQEPPAETGNKPSGSEGSDNNIETEETAPGTQTGGGTNEEIVDGNGNSVPPTDESSVAPPLDSSSTPETTPTTPTTPNNTTTTDSAVTPPTTPTPAPTPATTAPAATGNINIQGSAITFQDIQFTVPPGWRLHQDTFTDGTLIISFEKGSDYFRLYAKQGTSPSLQNIFVNGSTVINAEREQPIAGKSYKRIDTQKDQIFVSGFSHNYKSHSYFGFGRSSSTTAANSVATEFLSTFK
jgi:hypothetical protein